LWCEPPTSSEAVRIKLQTSLLLVLLEWSGPAALADECVMLLRRQADIELDLRFIMATGSFAAEP
jgi:hypothetical protein